MTTPRPSDLDHMRWIETFIGPVNSQSKILDLGCGSGYLCDHYAEKGAVAVGIDTVAPAVNATSRWQYMNLNLNEKNWHTGLKQQFGEFDFIFAFDIIEHLDSPPCFLESIRSILSSKGKLFLTTPNANSWERLLKPHTWSGAQDPQHLILFSRYSLQFLLRKKGLQTSYISAPVRRLGPFKHVLPIGGQIFSVSSDQQ